MDINASEKHDAALIFKKRITLQTIGDGPGEIHTIIHALEYENPYILSMIFVGEPYGRIDISKDQLAAELRDWLSGKRMDKAAVVVSERIRNSIMDFIKFGTPPRQTDLFLWLLSRTEVVVRGRDMALYFGGAGVVNKERTADRLNSDTDTNITRTTVNMAPNVKLDARASSDQAKVRPKSAPTRKQNPLRDSNNALSTFAITEQILGKSHTLSQLPQQRIKGREGATQSYVRVDWTEDHYRLTNHIVSRRQELEGQMETRRKILQTSHARQVKAMEKFRKLRESIQKNRADYNWSREAGYEVRTLDRMNETISEDIRRQKSRAIRTAEHVRWTMAPNGFVNRRGRYRKGISIGPGPLPADATTALRDPRIQYAVNHYYWDQHGRRHVKTAADIEEGSVVDQAMNSIRRAAVNASLYKLSLKSVFHDMDTSGDGFITISEMGQAFVRLGLKLEDKVLDALFAHFDPNNSGAVHYGEFVWAFFNRRSMVAQWKRSTRNLTKAQVRMKFRQGDKNGDGRLGKKEFKRLLASFSIKLSDSDIDILIDRFDRDGDGDLDLYEFADFVEKEMSWDESREVAIPAVRGVGGGTGSDEARLSRRHSDRHNRIDADDIPEDDDLLLSDDDDDGPAPPQYDPADGEKDHDRLEDTEIAEYSKTGNFSGSRTVSLDQLRESLQRQATIEAKLGKKYYRRK